MSADSLSNALNSLSASQRNSLFSEADKITGLSERKQKAEDRKTRLRDLLQKKLPKMVTPEGVQIGAGDDAMAGLIEQSPVNKVAEYSREVMSAVEENTRSNLLTADSARRAGTLKEKYDTIIETKLGMQPTMDIVERYQAEYGPRENKWLEELKQISPARAQEYVHARDAILSSSNQMRAVAREVVELQRQIDKQIEAVIVEYEKLFDRLNHAMRAISTRKRAAVLQQVRTKIDPQPPEKRLLLLSKLVEEMERRNKP